MQFTVLDEEGYFYVMGGSIQYNQGLNDVWKSSISFHDLSAVSKACGIIIPECGTGLKCFPGPDTVVATDGSFVSCAACTHPSLKSSSTSSVLVIVVAVFAVLFALSFLLIFYILYKLKASGVAAPIPLPDALKGWWSTSSTSDGHGLHSDLLGTQYVEASTKN